MSILPDLNQVGSLLLEVVCLFVIFVLLKLQNLLTNWIKTHTTSKQLDILHQEAGVVYAFVKAVYVEHDGPTKLAAAMAYLSSRLKARRINFTTDEMRAAIEAARLAYKSATTQPAAADPIVQVVEKLVPAQLAPEVEQLIAAAKALAPAAAEMQA